MRVLRHPSDLVLMIALTIAAMLFALFAPASALYITGLLFVVGVLIGGALILMRREE